MDASTSGAPANNATVSARLAQVSERFSAFYSDLEATKQQKRDLEVNRYTALSETVSKLERSLEAEIVRRAEADKALMARFDAESKAMEDRVALHLREVQSGIKASIDALARTFTELHGTLREEREARRAEQQRLAADVQLKLDELQGGLDDERVARLERECQTLKKIGEDVYRLQEGIDGERAVREATTSRLQAELSTVTGGRSTADDRFQAAVLQELGALRTAIEAERAERISEDETIVAAVNDYTRALQDGLRIVSAS